MLRVDVKINLNKSATIDRIKAAAGEALNAVGNQALKDMTQYVPKDQGSLQSSGIANSSKSSENLEWILRWDEPYAQYLFHGEVMYGNPTNRTYGPKKISFTDAMARMEWTKYAAEVYGQDWKTVFQAGLRSVL